MRLRVVRRATRRPSKAPSEFARVADKLKSMRGTASDGVCAYTCIHIYIYIYLHIHTYLQLCIYVYMYLYICTYMYIYIHLHIHTHIMYVNICT